MKTIVRYGCISFLLGAAFGLVDCGKSQNQSATSNPAPATGNLAQPNQSQANPAPQGTNQQAPVQQASDQSGSAQPPYDASYTEDPQQYAQDQAAFNEQPVQTSTPPPPLPDYSQPPAPGPNYIWTPGYWGYSSDGGYYWAPGAWVIAPWVGALWTPPYWGFYNGQYRWYHGYWAPHVGFYGGVNYGFGYTGNGYEGGRWNGRSFESNRAVANERPGNHVSYNGGRGGVNARPSAADAAVLREQRTPPVPAQIQHVRQAATNRDQLASVNHGKPAVAAAAHPLATAYKAPAERPEPSQVRSVPENRQTARVAPQNERPAPQQRAQVQAPGRPEQPQARTPFPENRPAPAARPAPEARPAPAPRPAPEARRAAPRPAPEARPEAPRPTPEARPAAPRPAPEARPAPRPAPEEHH